MTLRSLIVELVADIPGPASEGWITEAVDAYLSSTWRYGHPRERTLEAIAALVEEGKLRPTKLGIYDAYEVVEENER